MITTEEQAVINEARYGIVIVGDRITIPPDILTMMLVEARLNPLDEYGHKILNGGKLRRLTHAYAQAAYDLARSNNAR